MPANFSRPGDPDPFGRHFVDEASPPVSLRGSGSPGFHRKGFCRSAQSGNVAIMNPGTGKPRYVRRNQTASFRSDAASDRADRLYIVNRDEVMCKAESARRLQRRSGNPVSAIVSMESRPTSPAPRSSELSSLRSLQLSSSFRGDVRPDSAIVNPCSQRAGRQRCFL